MIFAHFDKVKDYRTSRAAYLHSKCLERVIGAAECWTCDQCDGSTASWALKLKTSQMCLLKTRNVRPEMLYFHLKLHQNVFGGQAPAGPNGGELTVLSQTPCMYLGAGEGAPKR